MFSRNLAFATASRILVGGSSVLVTMLLASSFAPEPFAAFRFYQITLGMLVTLAGPGLSLSGSKLFARFAAIEEAASPPPIALFCLLGTAMAAIIAIVLPIFPESLFAADIAGTVWLLSFGVFLTAAMSVPLGALIGLQKFRSLFAIDLLTTACLLIGILVALKQESIEIAVWSLIVSQGAGLLVSYFCILREISLCDFLDNLRTQKDREATIQVAQIAGPNALITLMVSLQFWGVGRIILTYSEDVLVFAVYSIAVQWFSLANMFPNIIGRTAFPKIVGLSMQTSATAKITKLRLSRLAVLLVLGSTLVITFCAYWVAPALIGLYGPEYAAHSDVIWQYAAATIPYSLSIFFGYLLLAHDKERFWLSLVLVQLLFVLAVCWALVSLGAASGAIALTAGGFAILGVAGAFAINRQIV